MVRDDNPGGADQVQNRRRRTRERVLKAAKIVFGQCVIDGLVLDISDDGARLSTAVAYPVSDRVMIRLGNGIALHASRRWARGTEIGLSIDRVASVDEHAKDIAVEVYHCVRVITLEKELRRLQEISFLGDPSLRKAAEDAEAGLRRLEAALLKSHSERPCCRDLPDPSG